MSSKKINCNCEHTYQDKTYGKGVRIGNVTKANGAARCTVCGKLSGSSEVVKKK